MIDKGTHRGLPRVSGLPELETIMMETACVTPMVTPSNVSRAEHPLFGMSGCSIRRMANPSGRRQTGVVSAHYRAPGWFTRNVFNRAVAFSTRHGVSILGSRVLAVKGHTSGAWRTTPVNLLEHDGRRYRPRLLCGCRGHVSRRPKQISRCKVMIGERVTVRGGLSG